MYRSEPFIDEFYARITAVAAAITPDYEIILVNDGSPDQSAEQVRKLCGSDPHLVLVDLSRNFGHHAAIIAGLEQARGDWIYLTDIDLEEQPEWLNLFWEKALSEQKDVVFGVQKERIGSGMSNFVGRGFWWLLKTSSTVEIPENQMTCRIFSRRYLDSLLSVRDRVIYLGALFPWTGYDQVALELIKKPRSPGTRSTYSLTRKLGQTVDSLTSFTARPLTFFFVIGLLIWLASLAYGAWLIATKLLYPSSVASGFTSLMFSIWFLGGLIMLAIGVVGQYVAKLFQEVKDRPRYIVRSITRGRE